MSRQTSLVKYAMKYQPQNLFFVIVALFHFLHSSALAAEADSTQITQSVQQSYLPLIITITALMILLLVSVLVGIILHLRSTRKQLQQTIEEYKNNTQLLQQSKQTLQDALTAVSDGVWSWNITSGEATLDIQAKRILGLPDNFVVTRSDRILQYIDKRDIPEVKAAIAAVCAGEVSTFDHEYRIQRSDGEQRWVRFRGKDMERDHNNAPVFFIGTMTDITEQRQNQQMLQFEEQRFHDLIAKVLGISIQGYDKERRVIFWNKASEELYGYSREEAIGSKLEDLIIPAGMVADVIRLHTNWLESGEEIPAGELILKHRDGHDVPVFSSHVMRTTGGKSEMYCIDVDLSPIKEANDKRIELEDQLHQSHKMEAIGTLAGGIAHDFNNVLAIITGNVEMALMKVSAEDKSCKYLLQARTALSRARDLVEQILIYSRRDKSQFDPMGIEQIITESVRLLRASIPVTVEIATAASISGENHFIVANATQVQQVLINLCNNAAHAMGRKGVITIDLETLELQQAQLPQGKDLRSGSYVCLKIKDNGSGIDEKTLPRIFDPFFTTKKRGEGTGMGLAVVQGIVEDHGGFIKVLSTIGAGTEFQVFFPRIETHGETSPQVDQELFFGHEQILVVDDEEDLADIYAKLLTAHGYKVQTSTNSHSAFTRFSANPGQIDLIITDLTMPGMDGLEFSQKLRSVRNDIPIILCTGYNDRLTDKDISSYGIAELVIKPIDIHQLLKKVRNLLDR